ncbi:MAG: hypothetical protein WBG86_17885 [Polyangiales bacterium]
MEDEEKWAEFEARLRSHDWYHAMSDSYGVHVKGRAAMSAISIQHAELGAIDPDRADLLYWGHCPWFDNFGRTLVAGSLELADDQDLSALAAKSDELSRQIANDPSFKGVVDICRDISLHGKRIASRESQRVRAVELMNKVIEEGEDNG